MLGDSQDAMTAYDQYLAEYEGYLRTRYPESEGSYLGGSARIPKAIGTAILAEGDRLYRSREYVFSQRYYDMAISRFPETQTAQYACYRIAVILDESGRRLAAAHAYRELIAEAPDSRWATEAKIRLPYVLFNLGRPEAAVAAALDASESVDIPERAAAALLCAAELRARADGSTHKSIAGQLSEIAKAYTGTNSARVARLELLRMQKEEADAVMDEVFHSWHRRVADDTD